MPRRAVQIYDQTSAVGGSLDTGELIVEDFDALIVVVAPAGAASGACAGNVVAENGDAFPYRSVTGILAGASDFTLSIGPGRSGNAELPPGPTRSMSWQAAAGGGGTVRLIVIGIKHED